MHFVECSRVLKARMGKITNEYYVIEIKVTLIGR
jgi:hypothetical protein